MGKRLLLAGIDDLVKLQIMENIAGEYDLAYAKNTDESIQVLNNIGNMIVVVLVSTELFCMNDYNFIQKVREEAGEYRTPIICIGNTTHSLLEHSAAYSSVIIHGALNLFMPPYDYQVLCAYIKNICGIKANVASQDCVGLAMQSVLAFDSMEQEGSALLSQLRFVTQNISSGITIAYDVFDAIKYEYSNEQFFTMFGYTREEFQEEEISLIEDLVLPSFAFEVKSSINSAKARMKSVVLVFQAKRKDESIIWVKMRCIVHFVKSVCKVAYITFYEDMTALKTAEARVQVLNEKLAHSEIYVQLDITNNIVEQYHSVYEPDDDAVTMPGLGYKELLLRYVYQSEKESIWDIMSFESLNKNFNEGNTRLSIEYRRHTPNGEIKWFTATAILLGGVGNVVNAFIYAHDIDNDKKERLAKERIIDSNVSDIAIINIAGGLCRSIKTNEIYISSLDTNYGYEEGVRTYIQTYVVDEDRAQCLHFFRFSHLIPEIEKNGFATISFSIIKEKGIPIRENIIVTYLDSTHEDLLQIGHDITEMFEKETEQQMALQHAAELANLANHAKSDFLSRMSHDMRTPLNAIIGMTKLAINECHEPQVIEYIKSIDVSGQFLLSLINDSLDLSKIESGKMEFHREPFQAQDFLRGLNTVIKPLMDAKNIEFVIDLDTQADVIYVDKMRFNQIFYNLLSNACKYTPEGGKVEFFSEALAGRNGRIGIRFHVRDNGIGMSKEFQKNLFKPFTQEYSSVSEEQKGTGLGLAIVKKIVDLVKGDIQVISELGKGTEFIVDVYVHSVNDYIESSRSEEVDTIRLQGIHVLLVDDREINTCILQKMLELQGSLVDVADNGKSGVEKFEQSDLYYYDIILTDVRMPIMDGYEETRAIRALDRPDATTIPIIAATADAFEDIRVSILKAGMNERLIKPIAAEDLYRTILRLIPKKQEDS